jgi:hypothetical protein
VLPSAYSIWIPGSPEGRYLSEFTSTIAPLIDRNTQTVTWEETFDITLKHLKSSYIRVISADHFAPSVEEYTVMGDTRIELDVSFSRKVLYNSTNHLPIEIKRRRS